MFKKLLVSALLATMLLSKDTKLENTKTKEPEIETIENIEPQNELIYIRCTCYVPTGNLTADGTVPYEGSFASNRANLGRSANLYDSSLNYIGTFTCHDTGGARSLRNGTSIDMFRNSLDRAYEWVDAYGDYVYIEWID